MTETKQDLPGFQKPRQANDGWTAKLYEKHKLGVTPSLEQIEPVATRLLSSPLTLIEAGELVLGRRIDANEKDVTQLLFSPTTAEERFGLLLIQKSIEEMMQEH